MCVCSEVHNMTSPGGGRAQSWRFAWSGKYPCADPDHVVVSNILFVLQKRNHVLFALVPSIAVARDSSSLRDWSERIKFTQCIKFGGNNEIRRTFQFRYWFPLCLWLAVSYLVLSVSSAPSHHQSPLPRSQAALQVVIMIIWLVMIQMWMNKMCGTMGNFHERYRQGRWGWE